MKIASTAIALVLAVCVPALSMANETTEEVVVPQTGNQNAPVAPNEKKKLKLRKQAPSEEAHQEIDGAIEYLAPDLEKSLD